MKSTIKANSPVKLPIEPALVVEGLFLLVRAKLQLGIGELQAALDAVHGGWDYEDQDVLAQVLRLLWCHSWDDRRFFDANWEDLMVEVQPQKLSSQTVITEADDQSVGDYEPMDLEGVVGEQKWLPVKQDVTSNSNWGIEFSAGTTALGGK